MYSEISYRSQQLLPPQYLLGGGSIVFLLCLQLADDDIEDLLY